MECCYFLFGLLRSTFQVKFSYTVTLPLRRLNNYWQNYRLFKVYFLWSYTEDIRFWVLEAAGFRSAQSDRRLFSYNLNTVWLINMEVFTWIRYRYVWSAAMSPSRVMVRMAVEHKPQSPKPNLLLEVIRVVWIKLPPTLSSDDIIL